MSGEDIPYQLRPNKFIDRQMFIELLSRLIVPRGPEKYVYVSMGGRHLIDHHAIYNQLGIEAQFSFDQSQNEILRQNFNRPTGKTMCVVMNSADLPGQIDTIFQKFRSKKNLIVWLDYTNTDRRSQLQEMVQTIEKLSHGDVLRITMNANPQTLCDGDEWKKAEAKGPAEYRADRLRLQVGEFLPTEISAINEADVPEVLAKCVHLAATAAERSRPNLHVEPVLITSYRDGQRMLTVTCAVSERDDEERFPGKSFARWEFASTGWDDVEFISAPVLSLREQYRLDANLHRGSRRMLAALTFLPAKDDAASLEAVESYRTYHRYYPTFRHVED
jgi:hypothetical protein